MNRRTFIKGAAAGMAATVPAVSTLAMGAAIDCHTTLDSDALITYRHPDRVHFVARVISVTTTAGDAPILVILEGHPDLRRTLRPHETAKLNSSDWENHSPEKWYWEQ